MLIGGCPTYMGSGLVGGQIHERYDLGLGRKKCV